MIEQFVKQLLAEKNLPSSVSPQVREQMTKDLTERATDLVNRRLIEAMTDGQAEQFEKLISSQPEGVQAAQQFIEKNLPNKDQVVAGALTEFRNLYLGVK